MFEYTNFSAAKWRFLLQRLENSQRKRVTSVSRLAGHDTSNGWLCSSDNFCIMVSLKMAYNIFLSSVLFTYEARFTWEGFYNTLNSHVLAVANSHHIRSPAEQRWILVNFGAGIVGDQFIGPYFFPFRLNCTSYWIFLKHVLPQLLDKEQVSGSMPQAMWFHLPFHPY